ncbi:139_t:CDS:2 [Dentiscutata erythropus]|uniref:139_t:CDS:1 n=1 Tax=Dentiscutata erythropus TaxID=1348616 RepID=A0A9N9FX55_9GLOM|nr:139_t:CDS:2 [Dentiscutata erythropus]
MDLNSNTDHSNDNDTDHSNENNVLNHSNKKSNTKTKLRKNTSWVWQYFRRRRPSRKWKTRTNCTVIVKNKKSPNGRECGQLVKTQGSTGNFQAHLNTHGITKPIKTIDTPAQPTITEMFHRAAGQSIRQKESIDRALVEWIVTNLQPLYVLKRESFIKFIHVLNLYYELPSDKHVKTLIHQNYNYSVECLKTLFATEVKILLQLKCAIILMDATMSANNDYNIRKDAICLKSLMITEEE